MKRVSAPLLAVCASAATALLTAVVAFAFASRGTAQAETWAPTVVAAPASAFTNEGTDYAIARAASTARVALPRRKPSSLEPMVIRPLERSSLPTPSSAIAAEIVPAIQPDVGEAPVNAPLPSTVASAARLLVVTALEPSGAPRAAVDRSKALKWPAPSDDSLFSAPMEVRWAAPAATSSPGPAGSSAAASIAVNP